MKDYDKWRDNEVHRIGLSEQLKAETKLEKDESIPFIEVYDEEIKSKVRYRENIAEIYEKRGKVSRIKSYFVMPDLPYKKG